MTTTIVFSSTPLARHAIEKSPDMRIKLLYLGVVVRDDVIPLILETFRHPHETPMGVFVLESKAFARTSFFDSVAALIERVVQVALRLELIEKEVVVVRPVGSRETHEDEKRVLARRLDPFPDLIEERRVRVFLDPIPIDENVVFERGFSGHAAQETDVVEGDGFVAASREQRR